MTDQILAPQNLQPPLRPGVAAIARQGRDIPRDAEFRASELHTHPAELITDFGIVRALPRLPVQTVHFRGQVIELHSPSQVALSLGGLAKPAVGQAALV